jgi:outer membrane protein assembly complex protein YaeT
MTCIPAILRQLTALCCVMLLLVIAAPTSAQTAPAEPQTRPAETQNPRPAETQTRRTRPAQNRLIKVTNLHITGTKAVPASRLKAVLQTKESSWIPWGRKRYFDRSTFEADMRRIETYYFDHGYPDARVAKFDAALSEDQSSIKLTIIVNEGTPVIIDDVVLEGLVGLGERRIESLRNRLPIKPGQVRERELIDNARGMVARTLQNQGYPFSRVAVEERPGATNHNITVALVGLVGEEAVFGPIAIEGSRGVGENVIRRSLAFEPGERFNLRNIQQSQRRLYDLELFSLVNIANASEQVIDGQVPIRVTVAEADHRQVKFSAGYGSEERLRGEAMLKHLNFLGGARTASIQGKWSSLDRGVRTELRQPYLFRPDLSLSVTAQRWFADEPAYKLHTRGGRATLTHELSAADVIAGRAAVSSISAAWIYEQEEYSVTPDALGDLTFRNQLIALGLDPRTGEGAGLLNALSLDFRRSTAGNVLDSRRGYVLQAHAERGGGWLPGDFNYLEVSAEGRHYLTIQRRAVLAHRVRLATIDGRGSEESSVPFFKRYFLGGSNSLRGWGRFEVSPLSGSGLPLGGHSLVELSSELRVSMFRRFGWVVFLDAGTVRTDTWNFDLSNLHSDAGLGFRFMSPVGPLRIDVARQLNHIPGLLVDGVPEKRFWRLHLSIGQTF